MMRKLSTIGPLLMFMFLFCRCITEIEPGSIDFDDLLVVEALITDQPVKHTVKLSRTVPINSQESSPVSNADVRVETSDQGTIFFFEDKPGTYLSNLPIAAKFGTKYQLKILTEDGKAYESSSVEMVATPPIDNITAEFIKKKADTIGPALRNQGDFNFYLDAKNNQTKTRSFRYLWRETYKIKVPNPSRWKWLGGSNFVFRNEDIPEEQEEFCFRYDSSRTIILNRSLVDDGSIVKYPIHTFDTRSRRMNIRYSIEVIQYGLSVDSEKYWYGLAASAQTQGSLFDVQPGTITANIKSVSNENEIVLGIFEVVQEQRFRAFYRAFDFTSQGYQSLTQFWIDCDDIEQVQIPIENAGSFMAENFENYELLYFSTGGPANFGIKRCALCTLYGTNKRPEFWID